MKPSLRRLAPFCLALGLPLMGGCISIGGHSAAQVQPTVGQQLIDLQKAREAGALSESDYELQRAKLLGTSPPAHD